MSAQPAEVPEEMPDPLLECLVVMTQLAQRPQSLEALRAGLPLEAGLLTVELLPRAAARAGLLARVVRKPLAKLPVSALPAILLLQNGGACVLASVDDNGIAKAIFPEVGGGAKTMPLAELEASYAGRAIFAHPEYRGDTRFEGALPGSGAAWFWGALWRYKREYAEVLMASALINFFMLASSLFAMNVYDRVVPNNAQETLWALTIGVLIVFLFDFILRELRGYFLDVVGRRIDVRVSATLFSQVMGLQLKDRPASAGSFANNLREFETVREFFTSATMASLIDMPFALLLMWVVAWIGGPLVLVPLLALVPVFLTGLLLQVPLTKVVNEMFVVSAQKQGFLTEVVDGLETVKVYGAEGQMQRRWEEAVMKTARTGLLARQLSAIGVNITQTTQQLVYVLVVFYGVFLIADGKLTVGGLIACSIISGRALAPLSQIAGLLTRYQQARAALRTLNKIMAMAVERPPERVFLSRPTLRGDIELQNVKFNYPGAQQPVLDGVTLKIAAGERVAVLGRVGSGKSSIAKLLMGLYAANSGSVIIDGTEIGQIDPADLRRNIGYVPQDIRLFHGSVRNNITIGKWSVSDAALMRAAELSGVSRFVSRHPAGLDLPVGEQGRGLSGGQRQAVASARAFLNAPQIMLLDEPTSAMDFATEKTYIDALRTMTEGRTLLIITHKPSMLALVTRIIVIEQGKVAADGPRDRILQALAGQGQGQAQGGGQAGQPAPAPAPGIKP